MEPQSELPQVISVIEEELVTGTKVVKTGSVRVRKEIEQVQEIVELEAWRDVISVEHVAINRPVSDIPAMREEGDTLIIPVIEEELIVQKRFVLKEEIHILRRRVSEVVTQSVALGRERVVVERLDAEGNVINVQSAV